MVRSFLIALQFLSRIQAARQSVWTNEDFGRAVIFFPLIGTVIGVFLWAVYTVFQQLFTPFCTASIVVAAWFYITGGLHGDGYMDTADGLMSGQGRERMLEIMKDSRAGAGGVMAFVMLAILKISFLASIPSFFVPFCLVSIPTAARLGALVSIFAFPYGRDNGLGMAFVQYQPPHVLAKGFVLALLPLWYTGPFHFLALGWGLLFSLGANRYICRRLGGVTGDTYGAVIEASEAAMLALTAIFAGLLFMTP